MDDGGAQQRRAPSPSRGALDLDHLTFEERIGLLVEHEVTGRDGKALTHHLQHHLGAGKIEAEGDLFGAGRPREMVIGAENHHHARNGHPSRLFACAAIRSANFARALNYFRHSDGHSLKLIISCPSTIKVYKGSSGKSLSLIFQI
jgi:hypothetical protein